ncbi:hypothetical protein FB451DRAFT_1175497 [Mycena latifolia]|nr:hypothetical protein FB451DRAFT_1175497 [Mycena latifolia]
MSQSNSTAGACSHCGSLDVIARLDVPPPPYPAPLISNYEPLESQIPVLRGTLEDTTRKICAIDEEMERALSALRRIPNEVLSEIFLWAIGKDETLIPSCWRVYPWSISKCAAGGEKVGDFYEDLEELDPNQLKSLCALISLQLERSGNPQGVPPIFDFLLTALTASDRWGNVQTPLGPLEIHTVRSFDGEFPALRELPLSFGGRCLDPGDTFESLPLLEVLTLYSLDGFPNDLKLPYRQLRKCTLVGRQSDVMHLLQLAPHCTDLSFDAGRYNQVIVKPSIDSSIRSLKIVSSGYNLARSILNSTHAPELDLLSIKSDSSLLLDGVIVSLLTRSSCSLTTLTVRKAPSSWTSFASRLSSTLSIPIPRSKSTTWGHSLRILNGPNHPVSSPSFEV